MLANSPWQILGSRCGKIVSYGSSVAGRTVVMGTVLMGGGKSKPIEDTGGRIQSIVIVASSGRNCKEGILRDGCAIRKSEGLHSPAYSGY